MSAAIWRQHFTFNKYSQICARATRQSLKESVRVNAEKRGLTALRYQNWENGQGGEQVFLHQPEDVADPKKSAAV